jgi:hypothetical protein
MTLDEVERHLIRRALDRYEGERESRGRRARSEPERALPQAAAA